MVSRFDATTTTSGSRQCDLPRAFFGQQLAFAPSSAASHAQPSKLPRTFPCVRSSVNGNEPAARPSRPEYIPNRIDDPNYVRIFDTTLRDGEQSPGATLTSKEKLDIARQLARLGVDIIEAGFPIASPDDLEAVRTIAKEVGNNIDPQTGYVPVICGLARCNKADIDASWEAVRHAARPRIHTFIATSAIHMEYKLRKTPDEVVEIARSMVAYAKSLGCNDIEFSPEDAGRWVRVMGADWCWWVLMGFGPDDAGRWDAVMGADGCWWVPMGARGRGSKLHIVCHLAGTRAQHVAVRQEPGVSISLVVMLSVGWYLWPELVFARWQATSLSSHPIPCCPRSDPEFLYRILGEVIKAGAKTLNIPDTVGSDPEFLYRILGEVIKAGATTLNIPDTVGYTMPPEFGDLIAKIRQNTEGAENVIISTHCQNDLGLATANTLAGAKAGARQLEVTINGIGERAGNASLEEVVMAIRCRGQEQFGGLYTGINPKHIALSSRMVTEYTGMLVQPHKAIVGANAFAHESGIHQDGMLKYKGTYEIMAPEDVGIVRTDAAGIVLGKHSGRHALKTRLQQMGYDFDSAELDEVFKRFKAVADKKKIVTDGDVEALVSDSVFQPKTIWELTDLQPKTIWELTDLQPKTIWELTDLQPKTIWELTDLQVSLNQGPVGVLEASGTG
ncbi:unnamed protein product [Closterium sp. NIES-53]